MHFRLRGSVGFWKVQKVDKSRHLFHIQWTHQTRNLALFKMFMRQFLHEQISSHFFERMLGQIYGYCSEKLERGLSGHWFIAWWKFGHNNSWEKDLNKLGPLHAERKKNCGKSGWDLWKKLRENCNKSLWHLWQKLRETCNKSCWNLWQKLWKFVAKVKRDL